MLEPHANPSQGFGDSLQSPDRSTRPGNQLQHSSKNSSQNLNNRIASHETSYDVTGSNHFDSGATKDLMNSVETRPKGSPLKTTNYIDCVNEGELLYKSQLKNGELSTHDGINHSEFQQEASPGPQLTDSDMKGEPQLSEISEKSKSKGKQNKHKHLHSSHGSKSGRRLADDLEPESDIVEFSDNKIRIDLSAIMNYAPMEEEEEEEYEVPKKKMSVNKYSKLKATKPAQRNASQAEKKKDSSKKQMNKTYSELIANLALLDKFDWLEATQYNSKLLPMKNLTHNSYWFMICSQYFPRLPFLKSSPLELLDLKFDQLKSIPNDFPIRIPKSFNPEAMVEETPLTVEQQQLLELLNSKLSQQAREHHNSKYHSKRKLEPEFQQNYKSADDEWILEVRQSVCEFAQSKLGQDLTEQLNVVKKVDLNDLIQLQEEKLSYISLENEQRLAKLKEYVMGTSEQEKWALKCCLPPEDPLVDLKLRLIEEESFLSLLEKKQIESKDVYVRQVDSSTTGTGSTIKPKVSNDDLLCFVCNDRDYSDNDLIVYCARCNMPVHQQCYGIVNIPKGDWICDLCLNFGPEGKYLRCPLCTKRGGALKPTVLWADTYYFANLNPEFHEFLSTYCREERIRNARTVASVKPKKPDAKLQMTKNNTDEISSNANEDRAKIGDDIEYDMSSVSSHQGKSIVSQSASQIPEKAYSSKVEYPPEGTTEQFYDAQTLTGNFTEEELENEPRPEKVWAHITCALFLPELYFNDKENVTDIDGFAQLLKDRFKLDCGACGKRSGAVVNCEKGQCKKAFHPECARRAKLYLEIKDSEQMAARATYTIFCEKHTPLQLRRTIETRDKKQRDDIHKFCRAVERYYALYSNESKVTKVTQTPVENPPQLEVLETPEKVKKIPKKPFIPKKLSKYDPGTLYLNLVEEWRKKIPSKLYTITLIKARHTVKDEFGSIIKEDVFKVTDTHIPRQNPHKKIGADDEVWTIMPYKNLTPAQKYKKYKKFMMKFKARERDSPYIKETKRTPTAKTQQVLLPVDPIVQTYGQDDTVYCICKQRYRGDGTDDLMLACDKCNEWYHFSCMGISEAGDAFQKASKMDWYCPLCREIEEEVNSELRVDNGGVNSVSYANGYRPASQHIHGDDVEPMPMPEPEEEEYKIKTKTQKKSKKEKNPFTGQGEPKKTKKVKK